MPAPAPARPSWSSPADSRVRDVELREFGFKAPRRERWRWIALVRGGPEALRRWAVGTLIVVAALFVALLLALACGTAPIGSCEWAPPLVIVSLALLIASQAAFFWYVAAIPALWEDPRHPAVLGQFAAGPRTYPSQDVLFDPEYGTEPTRR